MKHTFSPLAMLIVAIVVVSGCERRTVADPMVAGASPEQSFPTQLTRFQESLGDLNAALHVPGRDDAGTKEQTSHKYTSSPNLFSDFLNTLDADRLRALEDILVSHGWQSAKEWAAFGDTLSRLYTWQQWNREATKLEERLSQLEAAVASPKETNSREVEALRELIKDVRNDAPDVSQQEQALAVKFQKEIARAFAALEPLEPPASSGSSIAD